MADHFVPAATNLWGAGECLSTSEATFDYPPPLGSSHHDFNLPDSTNASSFKTEQNEFDFLGTDLFESTEDMSDVVPWETYVDFLPVSQSSIDEASRLFSLQPLSHKSSESSQNTRSSIFRVRRQRFACPEATCSLTFPKEYELKRHQRVVHSPSNLIHLCPYKDCQWHVHGFWRKDNLFRHLKSTHHDLSQSTILPPVSMGMEGDGGTRKNEARNVDENMHSLQEKLLELTKASIEITKASTEIDRDISALKRAMSMLDPDSDPLDSHRDHRDGRHIELGDCRPGERPQTTSESEPHNPLGILQSDNKPGKPSPYSTPSQEDETSSVCDLDTEHIDDEDDDDSSVESDRAPLLVLDPRRQKLFAEVMSAFWNDYNKNYSAIITSYIVSTTNTPDSQEHSTSTSRPRSATVGLASSLMINSSGRKRTISGDDAPSDDNDESPKRQKGKSTDVCGDDPQVKFACPFRKHNPTKYNIHQHKTCALRGFVSIHRTKEHVYRHHKRKIQCVRCWLYFQCQNDLDIHLSVENICERQPGQAAVGMTPDMEKVLRRRKKLPENQNDEDRWASMYRVLFPEAEGVPSPYFDLVQDNVAQARTVGLQPIEEYVRQQAPQLFMERLRMEIFEFCDSIFFDDQGGIQLHNEFVARLGTLTSVAVGTAIGSYRQIEFELGSGQASTIPHLSIDGSLSTPQAPFIETPPELGSFSQRQAYSQPSQDLQSFTRGNSVFGNDDTPGYYIQPADDIGKEASSSSQILDEQLPIADYATSFER